MTMVSYGYFGDLMRHSERLRWLGKYRYDVSGVRTFLAHRSYHGTLTYTEAAPASSPASDYCGQVVEYPPRVTAELTGAPCRTAPAARRTVQRSRRCRGQSAR